MLRAATRQGIVHQARDTLAQREPVLTLDSERLLVARRSLLPSLHGRAQCRDPFVGRARDGGDVAAASNLREIARDDWQPSGGVLAELDRVHGLCERGRTKRHDRGVEAATIRR